nr:hypothetical protein [Muribaculaceae bacterium]
MKRIYFLLLAAGVAMNAAGEKKEFGGLPAELRASTFSQAAKEMPGGRMDASSAKTVRANATPIEKLEKVNLWSFYSLLREDYGTQSETMYITIKDASTGAVGLHLGPHIPELAATFDATTGELSIPNLQYLFEDYDGPVYFYIKDIDEQDDLVDGASDKDASTAVYENGFLSFDPDEVWAIGNPDNEEASWYTLCMS